MDLEFLAIILNLTFYLNLFVLKTEHIDSVTPTGTSLRATKKSAGPRVLTIGSRQTDIASFFSQKTSVVESSSLPTLNDVSNEANNQQEVRNCSFPR